MAYSNLDGNVTDQNGAPVAGALVYVYDQPGGLADLFDGADQPVSNPVTTDEDGYWSAFAETDSYYTLKFFWGGRMRYAEANVLLGESVLGIQTDPNLRADVTTDTVGKGADMIPYRGRTVKSKLDDWRTPLDMGITGVGVGNAVQDTLALDAAVATGKKVVIPKGLNLITNTVLGHRLIADRQLVEIGGSVAHSGALPTIVSVYHGFFGLFSAAQLEGLQFIGGGTLSGSWDGDTTLDVGRVGTGLFLSNCPQAVVDGPLLTEFYDDGIKANNCAEMVVTRATRFFHLWNVGVEMSSYAANPFEAFGTAGGFLADPWTGTIYGPSGTIDGTYEWIDDGKMGAGNGTAIDFSTEPGAPACNNLKIRGSIVDCLLGVWSENNGTDAYNIDIDVLIRGNVRGIGDADPKKRAHCSDGVGLIGVKGGKVRAQIIDQTNIAPPSGAETAGLNIIQCQGIEADVRIVTDTGITNRMQHAIKLSGNNGVVLRGSQSGVTGISELAPSVSTPILFDTKDVSVENRALVENYNVVVDGFQGGDAASNWTLHYGGGATGMSLPSALIPLRFTLADVPASANTNLRTLGGNTFTKEVLPTAGRIVGVSAKASAALTGTLVLNTTVNGVAHPLVQLTEADFDGTNFLAAKQVEGRLCLQAAAKGMVEVKALTNGAWTNTTDIEVTLWFDPRWKA